MGCSRTWLGLVVALWSCNLQCLVFGTEGFLEALSDMHCGSSDLHFALPSVLVEFASAFTILDYEGKSHALHNDSDCGFWVGQKPDGSMLIGAAYDGCYVREEDGDYVVTLIVEQIDNGQVDYHKRDIKCPFLPALDAPSTRECAAIQRSDRLPCANSSVSRDVCEGLECCFSPSDSSLPCYYGNQLTAQCTDDNQVLIAISKDLTTPSLLLDSTKVLNVDSTSCALMSISKTSAFIMFRFPLSCGGVSQVSGNAILYENTIEATKDIKTWQGSSITRDSTMRLTVRCSYSQTGVVPLQVEVFTLPPPLPVSTSGPLLLEMRIARDMEYSSYYLDAEYPVTKVLRDPVYLEVRILRRTDPNLVLILNDCWATPSLDPTQQIQWPVLVDRCPFTGDNYLTQQVPVGAPSQIMPYPTHYQHFIVATFTFVDQATQNALDGLVYFHCSASVCIPSATDSCRTSCGQRKKRVAEEPVQKITVSKGPVDFLDIERPSNMKDDIFVEKEMSGNVQEHVQADNMLNETSEPGFIGAENEDPMDIDGDLIDIGKDFPRRVEGESDPNASTLMWLRAAAVGVGLMAVIVTILGVWRRHRSRSPAMHTVKI